MFDFDFFNSGFREADKQSGLLLEKLEIKHSSITQERFKQFLERTVTKGIDNLSVDSVTVPASPKRQKNPIDGKTYQSYLIKAALSDGQRTELLVMFSGKGKLEASTRGFITMVKLNGMELPLTSLFQTQKKNGKMEDAADHSFLVRVTKKLAGAVAKNNPSYAKRAARRAASKSDGEVATTSDDTTSVGGSAVGGENEGRSASERGQKLARTVGKKTGGGATGGFAGTSRKKKLSTSKALRDEKQGELVAIQTEITSISDQIAELKKQNASLRTQIANVQAEIDALTTAA